MDDLDERARAVLAVYKRARAADDDVHVRVRRRLATTLDERAVAATGRSGNTIAVGLVVAAALVLVFVAFGRGESRDRVDARAPSSAERTAVTPAPESADIATPPAELPATTTTLDRTGDASPQIEAPAVRRAAPERAAVPTSDLRRELELLQEAKRLRDAKDARAALDTLAEHARDFPRGQLAEERQALAIEIRCKTAERPRARADLEAFARAYSLSTHLIRLRRACE